MWFVHFLQHSVAEALLFLSVCESTVERYKMYIFLKCETIYISKFLVNGDVKPEPVGRSYGRISFNCTTRRTHCFCIPNMETAVPLGRAFSVRQLSFTVLSDKVFLSKCEQFLFSHYYLLIVLGIVS